MIRRWLAPVAGMVLLCLTASCRRDQRGATGSDTGRDRPVMPDTVSDPGAQVARRITQAGSLEQAIAGTTEAITRGGLVLSSSTGSAQRPVGPAAPFVVLAPEAALLAFEARRHATQSRLTLEELGSMLADFGWPFEGEGMPGDQLMRIVAAWIREARRAPNDPINFTPLFLADMGRRQIPAVDLAGDSTDPGDVRLGLLEVQLIAAALTRGLGSPVRTGRMDGPPAFLASYGGEVGQGPCEDAKKWFGGTLPGGVVGAFGGWGVGQALEKALEAAGLSEERVGQLTMALDAVATLMKVAKLAQLYGATQIDLDYASEMPAHRPSPRQDAYASVRARAGIPKEEYEEYRRSLKSDQLTGSVRNCLETLGLPTWSDLADVAADASGWRVKWDLGKGSPKHAVRVPERNNWYVPGQFIMQLKQAGPNSPAEATYTFKLTPEIRGGHPGNELRGEVQVTAELQTAKPPGLSTISDAMVGIMGLVKALADLGLGWFQTVVTSETYLMVPIRYHEPGISITIEDENQVVLDFRGKKRLAGMVGGMAAERSHHAYDGEIHLSEEDSLWHGLMRVMVYGTYTAGDSAKAAKRAAKYHVGENSSFEDLMKAWYNMIDVLGDIPTCNGTYEGSQTFEVKGQFVEGDQGQPQIELALIPVDAPEYYQETPGCAWGLEEIEGQKTLPVRIPKGERTAFVIDLPKPGEKQVYPKVVKAEGIYGSTVITVSDDRP